VSTCTTTEELLRLYCSLPHTPARTRPYDRKLARHWLEHGITPDTIRAALLLGVSRRLRRHPERPPLPAIRSLAYFQTILDEVLAAPLDNDYLRHLERLCRSEHGPPSPSSTPPMADTR
jgi:hypothetical protein